MRHYAYYLNDVKLRLDYLKNNYKWLATGQYRGIVKRVGVYTVPTAETNDMPRPARQWAVNRLQHIATAFLSFFQICYNS